MYYASPAYYSFEKAYILQYTLTVPQAVVYLSFYGAMDITTVTVLWLLFAALINISQESIVKPHGFWIHGAFIRYDTHITNTPGVVQVYSCITATVSPQ